MCACNNAHSFCLVLSQTLAWEIPYSRYRQGSALLKGGESHCFRLKEGAAVEGNFLKLNNVLIHAVSSNPKHAQ